jgi:CO/xanthine dehydrogenase Mo-binding subunit
VAARRSYQSNPRTVDGALVQGVGQALYENAIYDDPSGQLKTGSFMEWPRHETIL